MSDIAIRNVSTGEWLARLCLITGEALSLASAVHATLSRAMRSFGTFSLPRYASAAAEAAAEAEASAAEAAAAAAEAAAAAAAATAEAAAAASPDIRVVQSGVPTCCTQALTAASGLYVLRLKSCCPEGPSFELLVRFFLNQEAVWHQGPTALFKRHSHANAGDGGAQHLRSLATFPAFKAKGTKRPNSGSPGPHRRSSTGHKPCCCCCCCHVVNVFPSSRDFGLKHSQVAHVFLLKNCVGIVDV